MVYIFALVIFHWGWAGRLGYKHLLLTPTLHAVLPATPLSLNPPHPPTLRCRRRHFPVNKVTWHDVKGCHVILGSFEEAAKMMGDMNLLPALVNFPKEGINDETVELLQVSTFF